LESLLDPPPPPEAEPSPFDLATLVAQFTALRHDVNLQTKATRAATEQAATVAQQVAANPPPDSAKPTKPLLKVLIDIADVLAQAERQVSRSRVVLEPLVERLIAPALPDPPPTNLANPGFFGKLFGKRQSPSSVSRDLQQWVTTVCHADADRTAVAKEVSDRLLSLLAGVADGYAISLRRVENAFPQYGLEPIECLGRTFDPELMEVVEVVGNAGRTSGTVVEVVRPGYRLNGQLFRFAQVKVAR
jgi:molecular chaperone GrpE